jgi:hypothetical protein
VILYCFATAFGFFEQDTLQIALFIAPWLFALGLLSWLVGFDAARGSDSIL